MRGFHVRFVALLVVMLWMGSGCAGPRLSPVPSQTVASPVVFLPPIVTIPLSDQDSRYFKGIPVLFEEGSWKSLQPILRARLALPHLADNVRDRLMFDLALVELRLGDLPSRMDAEDLLIRLDAFGKPYEIREAAGLIVKFMKEARHANAANQELKKKLDQVRKTFRELSTLENSLR